MDKYLIPNSFFERLLHEYKKYGSLTISVDFDGTVHDFHKRGDKHDMVRQLVRDLKDIGCTIIIWTVYPDLNYVKEFCKKNNIPQDGVNEGGIPLPWESKKPFFSALLDDRAGLQQVFNELTSLVKIVKNT